MTARNKDLEQVLVTIQSNLIGASEAAIKNEMFNVFKEFFDESSSWEETVTMNSVANEDTYVLTPTGGQIVRLAGVVDENDLPLPAIIEEIGVMNATIKFRNPFTAVQEFRAYVIKTVILPNDKNDFPIVPDWVLPLWGTGITDGVLGKMLAHPVKTYTDKERARYHTARFQDAIAKATVAMTRRHTFGTQAWRFPSFACGSQRNGTGRTDRSFGQ